MLIHPHLTFVLYDKVVGEVVSPDTDILLVYEADIVVGEGDLVQTEKVLLPPLGPKFGGTPPKLQKRAYTCATKKKRK